MTTSWIHKPLAIHFSCTSVSRYFQIAHSSFSPQMSITMNKDSHTFVFVHAQNLQDLHSNKYDKHVRQAVMNNYLRKAMQDPSTTDRRITRQRRTDIRQRRKGATANYESPPDDHQSVGVENDVKLNALTPKSDESLAFVPANESPVLDHSPTHEAHTTSHSASGTPASNDGASQRRCSSVFFKEVSDPGVEIERYFESFNHIKEQVIPTAIDVEWLRWNCKSFLVRSLMSTTTKRTADRVLQV